LLHAKSGEHVLDDQKNDPAPGPHRLARHVNKREIDALGARLRQARTAEQEGRAGAGAPSDYHLLVEELGLAEEELCAQYEEILLARDQIEAERLKYKELFDLAPDGYLVTDLAGTIRQANQAASVLLATAQKQLERKPLISFVVEPPRRDFRDLLSKVAERRQPATIQLAIRTRDRSVIDVDAVVAPDVQPDGRCVGLRWLLRDVSVQRAIERENAALRADLERKVAQRTQDLRQAVTELEKLYVATATSSAKKSEFLAFLSHEIRTPMQALIGYADVLNMEVHGPLTEAQRNDIARMQRGQQHILKLVDQLLDYSRVESGRVDLVLESIALDRLCETSLDLVRPQAAQVGVKCVCGGGDVQAFCDHEKARQIIMNLVANAIKFGPPGGTVRVVLEQDSACARVLVHDEGSAIPEPVREMIFEPFVHLRRTTSGTGLGLPISRRLARSMNGDLTLRPAQPDEPGNTFVLELPRAP
jgi:PAS domain S-box-containing protein